MADKICITSRWLAAAWMATIFYVSSLPFIPTPNLFSNQDKLFHLVVYGILGVLLLLSFRYKSPGYTGLQITLAVTLASLYGISDEIHQSFVPGRELELLDWLADTLGALSATFILAFIVKKIGLRNGLTTGQYRKPTSP